LCCKDTQTRYVYSRNWTYIFVSVIDVLLCVWNILVLICAERLVFLPWVCHSGCASEMHSGSNWPKLQSGALVILIGSLWFM
jgi:hypothetical protein